MSAACAFGWEFWARQRLLLSLIVVYLLFLAALFHAVPAGTFGPAVGAQASVPLWGGLLVLLALFAHGDQADVLGRETNYPRGAFTLPLSATSLAGWPLLLGACAVSLLWLALAGLVWRPCGLNVPLWPAVFLIGFLSWMQALVWWPFPLPFLRVVLMTLVLGCLGALAILGHLRSVSPTLLLAGSAGLIPLGYLMAVAGVTRARRGDGAVWSWPARRHDVTVTVSRPFAKPADALFWLEWRRNGFLLPLLVGLLVVPQMVLIYFVNVPRYAALFLIGLGIYPPMMAVAAGASLGNSHPWSRKLHTLPAFLAARPVSTAEMIAVKLRAAVRTTLITWALIGLALLLILPFSAAGGILLRWTQQLLDSQGVKGWALLLLLVVGLPALTWKWIVNQLWIGLTGRPWLITTMSLFLPASITALGLFGLWAVRSPESHETLLVVGSWLVIPALLVKLGVGVLVARALVRRQLVSSRTVMRVGIVWGVSAAVLFGLALWLMPPEVYSPPLVGCAAVVLVLPGVRLGLAPLALNWNRHR